MNDKPHASLQRSALEQQVIATMQQDAHDELIAQAVRAAPLPALPADFATQVAASIARKREDELSELYFVAALLALLSLSGLWYAGIFLLDNFGDAIHKNFPLLLMLVAIVAMMLMWECLQRQKKGPQKTQQQ